ncbi:hypothetical protein KQ298_11000 [Synechococcus sp. CS-1330]|nr:hypothetical protein [Synechococcus sp. CS-1330]
MVPGVNYVGGRAYLIVAVHYGYAPGRGWAVVVDAILIGATAEQRRSDVPSLLRPHSWRHC